MRTLILLLALMFTADAANAQRITWRGEDWSHVPRTKLGRFCDQPDCRMCNRLFGPMPGYRLNWDQTSRKVTRTSPRVVQRPSVSVDPYTALDSSPSDAVELMLSIAQAKPGDVVYDPGCGDGRILIAAAKRGCKGIGVEINPETFKIAKRATEPYRDRITVVQGDSIDFTPAGVTLVTLYLFPPVIEKLWPNLVNAPSGTRIVSYAHPLPVDSQHYAFGEHNFYVYVIP